MDRRTHPECNLIASATAIPDNPVSTQDILSTLGEKISEDLRLSLTQLGVDERYSIIQNYPQYLAGKIDRTLLSTTTDLAIQAIKKCITSSAIDPSRIGLLISITNTSNRHLPCLGYEIAGSLSDLIPSHTNVVNMQDQGCSVLLKAVEIAQYYLNQKNDYNKDKYVIIVASEGHTGFIPPLNEKNYYGLRELKDMPHSPNQLINTMTAIESVLFGDGAIAFLLGVNDQHPVLGPIAHLTNVEKNDIEVIHMDEGGILIPAYKDYPHYMMSANVPRRGVFYTKKGLDLLFKQQSVFFHSLDQADLYFIHTGSKKILDGVCHKLNIETESEKARFSYGILKNFGNLSSVSVGFMINQALKEERNKKGLIISFGVGFSSSSGFIQL